MSPEEQRDFEKKSKARSMKSTDLVDYIYDTMPKSGPNYSEAEMAKAELTRRQTEAIHEFNTVSNRLAMTMIWLTVGIGILAFFQLVATFKR